MNAERRKALAAISEQASKLQDDLAQLRDDLDTLKSEESDYFDAMPESLQGGEKGERATAAVDALQTAYESLDSAFDSVGEAMDKINEGAE